MGELALERQEAECRERAVRDGVEMRLERVYSDLSISAADRRKRPPAYDRMLADVYAGEVGRVYVWDLDRLTRQPDQFGEWIRLAEAGRCYVVESHGQDLDLSGPGDLLVGHIRAAVAENESKHEGPAIPRGHGRARDRTRGKEPAMLVTDIINRLNARKDRSA